MEYKFLLFILVSFFISCGTETKNNESSVPQYEVTDTSIVFQNTDSIPETKIVDDTTDYENATYYFVIADTNRNYSILCHKMFHLKKQCHMTIDSLGRLYLKKKDLIALPENDEDEMYAGQYFPRRYPSNFLSLEYLDFYAQKHSNKTIALMAGVFETKHSADSLLSIIKPIEKSSFILKAKIYIGCMH
jgi:hypothetical protein